ncbi:MAG: hypothetical protein P1U77_09945 [Rubripirellula sp.]|nr:hypothetical protein [Rubripirellula sp.]
MSDKLNDLLSDWLDDGEPKPTGTQDAVIDQSSEAAADSLLVHGLLVDEARRDDAREARSLLSVMERIDAADDAKSVTIAETSRPSRRRRFAILTSALTIGAAVLVMLGLLGPPQNVSAAMASLEKVIDAAAKPFDRTYSVSVIEEYPRGKKPRNLSQEAWEREAEEEIDGATLFVSGANQFVLSVMLRSGIMRTIGCDGKVSWAFRENGPVHVSTDLSRFRGGVPGGQQDLPFMNMHANLSQLRSGYEVELKDKEDVANDGTILSQLVGVRQSRDVRGPKRIDIWFDANSGTVHRILLDGLPRGRGGPKSVMLELEDQSDLPSGFFSHGAHHEPGKRIRYEDRQR